MTQPALNRITKGGNQKYQQTIAANVLIDDAIFLFLPLIINR